MIALKNLLAERARFLTSLVGVAFAVMLVLIMVGIFVGTTNQVTTYIDHSRGSVWAAQPGVTQMFRSVSWLPEQTSERLEEVEGAEEVDPILGVPMSFDHEGTQTASYLLGYDTDTGVGGPWSLSEGRLNEEPGEVVLDRVMAAKNDVHVGDEIELLDTELTVVGLSEETAAVGNFYAFVSLDDAREMLRAEQQVSYFLITPDSSTAPGDLAERIEDEVEGVSTMTADTFASESKAIVVSMIGRPLYAMIAIGVLVGTALVTLTVLSVASEQMGEFGMLKAVGVSAAQLYRIVLTQALVLALGGYLIGAAVTFGIQYAIRERLGDVTVEITPWMLVAMAVLTLVMAAIGSIMPARRVARLDAAEVFRR